MKILVIDDDYFVRQTVARILRNNGHEVLTAGDGYRGMEEFRSSSPELVIIDIIMPRQEGIETIRAMRAERHQAKIIAISGGGHLGDLDVLAIAHKLGADEVLAKPFDAEELLSRVDRMRPQSGRAGGVAA